MPTWPGHLLRADSGKTVLWVPLLCRPDLGRGNSQHWWQILRELVAACNHAPCRGSGVFLEAECGQCVPVSHLLHHFDHLHQHCSQVVNCLMNQKLPSREQSYYPNDSETSTSFSARSNTLVHAPQCDMFFPFFFCFAYTPSEKPVNTARCVLRISPWSHTIIYTIVQGNGSYLS